MATDKEVEEFKRLVVEWLEKSKRITLMGRFFDCSKDEGRQEFAEWITDLLHELYHFHEEDAV